MGNSTILSELVKENSGIYRDLPRLLGLSDADFWILYFLRESNEPMTQSKISRLSFLPKQTVNSALKKMERDGYVVLRDGIEDKRSKTIEFTDKGLALCASTVDRVLQAEEAAFNGLSSEQQSMFITLFQKWLSILQEECERISLSVTEEAQ